METIFLLTSFSRSVKSFLLFTPHKFVKSSFAFGDFDNIWASELGDPNRALAEELKAAGVAGWKVETESKLEFDGRKGLGRMPE